MSQKRNSNFELMRIISMFFIVIGHILMHGNVINNCSNPILKLILELIMFAIIIHVNSYILLTGYFQSDKKFKLKKIIKLILQMFFYIIICFIICAKMHWINNYNIISIINFITKSIKEYWFIHAYLIMYAFSDYINILINSLDKRNHQKFIITGFILLSLLPFLTGHLILENTGYNFFSFIYLYIVGAYLKKYPITIKDMNTNTYRLTLFILFILILLTNFLLNKNANKMIEMGGIFQMIAKKIIVSKLTYSNPLVIIQTIIYFEIFRTFNFQNKITNYISNLTFGIYLFHDNYYIRNNIYKATGIDNGIFTSYNIIIKILLLAILIYILGIILEIIRNIIFNKKSH